MATLTQLEYAVAVDRERHFGHAAQACHVSQPTLSTQLQKLEDELGHEIFDRLKRPLMPTPRGKKFIDQAKIVLQEYEKLLHVSKSKNGEISGEFRLGVIPTVAPYLIPLFIAAFSKTYPLVTLHIDEIKTSSIVEGLNAESLDAGILATPLHEKSLREISLFFEPFLLYVAKDHPLARKKRVREEDLDGKQMWLLQDGHCFRSQIIRFCSPQEGPSFYKNVYFEGGNLETLRILIRESGGYTMIPSLFADSLEAADRKIHVREFIRPVPTREISLVCKSDLWKLDILQAIKQIILKSIPQNLLTIDKEKQIVLPLVL